MAMIDYRVKRALGGKQTIQFTCPKCSGALESPIIEAGTKQECPTCRAAFITPGKKELDEIEADRKRREAEAAHAAELDRSKIRSQQAAADRELMASMNVKKEQSGIPTYDGLTFGGMAFRVIGILSLVLAGVVLVLVIVFGGKSSFILMLPAVGYSVGCLITGMIFMAFAAACDALRDIALNSHQLVKQAKG